MIALRLAVVPALARHVLDNETPALHRSNLLVRPRLRRTLAGRLCPNAVLDDGSRFDDVAGGRFAVVTADLPSETERTVIQDCDAVLVTARPSGEPHRWLRNGRAGATLVRPDGTVLSASSSLSRLCRVLPWFTND